MTCIKVHDLNVYVRSVTSFPDKVASFLNPSFRCIAQLFVVNFWFELEMEYK